MNQREYNEIVDRETRRQDIHPVWIVLFVVLSFAIGNVMAAFTLLVALAMMINFFRGK